MEDYIKDKIFRYCDRMKEQGQDFTLYDVHVEHVNDYWNLVTGIYGMWLARNSDFVPVEFSETNFDMVEYKAGENDI